jgi:hypothetical protein
LNARLHPDDVVLAMPQVSWLFQARTAELLQAVAITGRASAFYPGGIPRRRWVYDVHLAAARYLVVDTFTCIWISQNSAERALVRRAEHTWRLVYAHGEYQVYENPAHAASSLQATGDRRQNQATGYCLLPATSCLRPSLREA